MVICSRMTIMADGNFGTNGSVKTTHDVNCAMLTRVEAEGITFGGSFRVAGHDATSAGTALLLFHRV